jgi:hypothetical protein
MTKMSAFKSDRKISCSVIPMLTISTDFNTLAHVAIVIILLENWSQNMNPGIGVALIEIFHETDV